MGVDLFLVVAVVAQGIKDLRQREMGQPTWHFLRRNAKPPELNNGAYGGTGAADNRLSTENLVTQSRYRHELLPAAWLFPSKGQYASSAVPASIAHGSIHLLFQDPAAA